MYMVEIQMTQFLSVNLTYKVKLPNNKYFIFGGDWNLVLNPDIEMYNYININNPRARACDKVHRLVGLF